MSRSFNAYFRSPVDDGPRVGGTLSSTQGYFRFDQSICFGGCAAVHPSVDLRENVPRVPAVNAGLDGGSLPFDLDEVVTNLQYERYPGASYSSVERAASSAAAREAYYLFRPLMPVGVRKHLQRARLSGWEKIPFPRWPVDLTVQALMGSAMTCTLRRHAVESLPFIWFWPDGTGSCVVMTHDIEGRAGREFTPDLMDIDDSFGLKAAFQVVPEWLSGPLDPLLEQIRTRGFEVNLHDLNHDGSLFRERKQFRRRATEINRHARELGCKGFRSGAMYREQDWYHAFEFSFDMSVPNVAHLEPQRGGCCTVLPYFIGRILELPLTTTQDYSLFHILNDYSITLWKRQIEMIRGGNGLISFITHPDYLVDKRARTVYVQLLEHLAALRSEANVWMAVPGEVDRWWRERDQMKLRAVGNSWVIEGPGSERARIAYATLHDGELVYTLNDPGIAREQAH